MLNYRTPCILLATLFLVSGAWALPSLPVPEAQHAVQLPAIHSAEAGLATVAERDGQRRTGVLVINSLLLVKDGIDVADLNGDLLNDDAGGDALAGALYAGLTIYSFSERAWRVSGMIGDRPTAAQRAYTALPAGDATMREDAARDALARLAKRDRRNRLIFGVLKVATGVYLVSDNPFTGDMEDYNNEGYSLAITGAISLFRPTSAEKAWKTYERLQRTETNHPQATSSNPLWEGD